ncbi:2-oxoisovalerate dehydrogenase E1 component [Catalinimonas alkaloidigena]|uniref:2-oxoisovalerate dehydrogenase E1 component n=1 Tax=Catalinimonas alkaloidigena TaxID=1075417 RepID=A0A1G9MKV6_9BACT|nr:dehydrogenase E1 component subunit alpha/beta [Catalinimonas alkaloidigena]SDL74902.1 2-oxoisovalerate dehydrogenase E1 component [Catalinimonas alkaloidigena]
MSSAVQEESILQFDRKHYTDQDLLALYEALLKPRMIEEKMLILLRQGKISKWFSGIGQEAIAVGVTCALRPDEYILPLHRNLGVFTQRQLPLARLFAQFQGKASGYTRGRDRSFHFGDPEHYIVGMISHLGPQLSVADGLALAHRLWDEAKVVAAFSGDGGTSEGEFHEALNVASVWQLPVLFIVENNGYGLSTPSDEQFRCKSFVDKGLGYGMEAVQVDGNNILDIFDTIRHLAASMRENPRPVLVEAMTFRMRGHEEASGTKYVPSELLDTWARKDPVQNFEAFLRKEGVLDDETNTQLRARIQAEIDAGLQEAFAEPAPDATERELADVYAPHVPHSVAPAQEVTSDKRFVDAIADAIRQSFERYPQLVLMGQDVAEYGGVFKVTEGLMARFGKARVRNTPLCESAIVGVGVGLSIAGWKSIVEMQFADFVTCGFNQIVNNLAKLHYRWQQAADVVIRMPTGAGVGAGPFHSQSNEAWFFHTPGLKVVYPSTPYDAKGLLNASIEDPNPVLYFEHKALYRSLTGPVPDDYYTLPLGQASIVASGEDVTIITYGMGVHWAQEVVQTMAGVTAEIVDLRTLLPWDHETVEAAVRKTGRVLILHEDCLTGGIGGEIAAWIAEHCFVYLDAPVMRVGALDTPVPFAASLEKHFLPRERLAKKVEELLAF